MFLFDAFFASIWPIVAQLVRLYEIVIIAAVVVSWVGANPWNPLVRFLRVATEPVFARIRRWLPFAVIGGLDLSPMILILGLHFLTSFISNLYWRMPRGF
jgi:YggT family protein